MLRHDERLESVEQQIKEKEEEYTDLAWNDDPRASDVMLYLDYLYGLRSNGELYIPKF